ncbi:MAG TPA: helix-turn-helix domain-containing protein [Nitrospiraceae bacterium]|nr:helix-turn-helix domain-containing protein [Nitrospiraceae bacterium]
MPLEQSNPKVVAKIIDLRGQGTGMKKIAREVGVSSRTVWRVLQATTLTA